MLLFNYILIIILWFSVIFRYEYEGSEVHQLSLRIIYANVPLLTEILSVDRFREQFNYYIMIIAL